MTSVYGSYSANKIQLGREATAGTAVASTGIWRGEYASLEDARTREIVTEQVGLMVNTERSYDSQYLGRISFPATPMTFEQVLHLLEAGVGTVSPVNAAPKYTYNYAFSVTNTPNTLKTYTIEAFNTVASVDCREMEYSFVESFTLSMTAGEAWMMSADWVGRQLTKSTGTALTTLVTVEEALGALTTLFIDPIAGAPGAAQKSGVLMGAEITVNTGRVIVPVGDGTRTYAAVKMTVPEITFSLTLELEQDTGVSMVEVERVFYETNVARLFELNIAGSDANHSMVIDWAGKYDSFGSYENADGNTTVTMTGHAIYTTAPIAPIFWEASVANTLASIA